MNTEQPSTEIDRDALSAALLGQTITSVEVTGDEADSGYVVLTAGGVRLYADSPTGYAIEGSPSALKLALTTVQSFADETEARRRQAVLFVAYDRKLDGKDGLLVDSNPYDWTQDAVNGFEGYDLVQATVYEGDYLKGEDYETIDANEGEGAAYRRVLDVLQLLASGTVPEQTKAALGEEA